MSHTDCPSQDTLSDFVLGKLPIPEQGTVVEHLDVCPECERKTELIDGMADAVVSQLRRVSDPDSRAVGDSKPTYKKSLRLCRLVRRPVVTY
jgi:anti-sigma factor RsiW